MNLNLMSFMLGKMVADKLGEQRSTQLGMIAGMMPGFQGVMISALIAQREEPAASAVVDASVVAQQNQLLKKLFDELAAAGPKAVVKQP